MAKAYQKASEKAVTFLLEETAEAFQKASKKAKCNKDTLDIDLSTCLVDSGGCEFNVESCEHADGVCDINRIIDVGFGCFPADATVEVLGKGFIAIEHVMPGDMVRSANGFSKVYGHSESILDRNMHYVRIKTESSETIELSGNHIIFMGKEQKPIYSIDIKKGDLLTPSKNNELSKVTEISLATKRGLVHPLTDDGTIVVNGIVASVHSSCQV
jgi:hypothetical protein